MTELYLLKFNESDIPATVRFLQVADGDMDIGDRFVFRNCVHGGPKATPDRVGKGVKFSGHEGMISSVRMCPEDNSIVTSYMIEGAVLHGTSGSPICNRLGAVYGVITQHIVDGNAGWPGRNTNLGVAVSLRAFLASVEQAPGIKFLGVGKSDDREETPALAKADRRERGTKFVQPSTTYWPNSIKNGWRITAYGCVRKPLASMKNK